MFSNSLGTSLFVTLSGFMKHIEGNHHMQQQAFQYHDVSGLVTMKGFHAYVMLYGSYLFLTIGGRQVTFHFEKKPDLCSGKLDLRPFGYTRIYEEYSQSPPPGG